ncbi:MAG TPA: hypothetical protein VH834_23550 [Solirubrobacteraceae bacterium]|jgi:hypothetical protein
MSAAEATLLTAWASLATGLLAYGFKNASIGPLLLAAFALWQMSHVWQGVQQRRR